MLALEKHEENGICLKRGSRTSHTNKTFLFCADYFHFGSPLSTVDNTQKSALFPFDLQG